ncbi:MAG: RdgB/HAM1 family non-canonical purine NTP pyrophosphatase [Candidatus Omnitrophica bacterium]|nr:RdgB/HAM1 family non-canonical purine NTP pyrophosphatase [Candidatus Omnitrophota bacterium]
MRLIIATKNLDKFREIKQILSGIKIPVLSLNDITKTINIKETGKTFFENAFKKAYFLSKVYQNDLVVGEDSGLVVHYLGGKPGVYSKRYSGKNYTYHKNNLKILKQLKDVEYKKRKAYFVCVLVLLKNGKLLKKYEGRLYGYIAREAKGSLGFGYDPIFYLPKYKKTVAQLSPKQKNKISHRAKAFLKLKNHLNQYVNFYAKNIKKN